MTKKQTKVPARTLGHEMATEVCALTGLDDDEVDQVAGARMANTWSPGCGDRCSLEDD